APEQARDGTTVDARCDLFSLGCILYRLCTGRVAFQGGDIGAILVAVTTHQPPPPVRLSPGLPVALSNLVMGLLANRPEGGPPSAAAAVAAPSGLRKVQPARVRRRQWPVLAGACALLLAVGAAIYWRPASDPAPVLDKPPQDKTALVRRYPKAPSQ